MEIFQIARCWVCKGILVFLVEYMAGLKDLKYRNHVKVIHIALVFMLFEEHVDTSLSS